MRNRNVRISNAAVNSVFDNLIVPRGSASPLFVLRRLRDFLLRNSPGLPDKRVAAAEKESF